MAVPVSDSPAWTVYCDGSAVPNPGRMGLGALLIAPDGSRHALSRATHSVGCNNEAELRALTEALLAARAQGAAAVQVYSDNSILVEQLGGRAVKPIERLADLFDEARALLASFERVALQWIPRHRNAEADALARAALGMAPKPAAKPRGKAGRRHKARA
ncbi:ribonuclease HI family protein [Variovorax boronicumulans]|uniref:ribonuclease HI family protein n=1 Tax=Variovorax boronicumulans TaxID=436515 RepID=UPI001C55F6C1